jgi:hypothetical protein
MLEPAHLGTWEESKLYLAHELNRMANALEGMATTQQDMLKEMQEENGKKIQQERDQARNARILGTVWGFISGLSVLVVKEVASWVFKPK